MHASTPPPPILSMDADARSTNANANADAYVSLSLSIRQMTGFRREHWSHIGSLGQETSAGPDDAGTFGAGEHGSMRAWEPAGAGLPRAASTARAGPLIHNYTQLKGRDARASHVDPRAGCRLIWGRGGRRKRPCEQGTSQGGRPFMESKNKPNAPQDPTYEPHTSERTHPPRKD